jgi:hypothetical protein
LVPLPRPQCEQLPASFIWKRLYGASIAVPADFVDTTEYAFLLAEGEERYLAFSREYGLDAAEHVAEKREVLSNVAAGWSKSAVSAPAVSSTAMGEAHWFTMVAKPGPGGGALGLAVVSHRDQATLIRIQGQDSDVARLPDLLASLEPLGANAVPEVGRYAVLDLSFAWPKRLLLPSYLRFERGETRLRLSWEATLDDEFAWGQQFSFPAEQTPRVIAKKRHHASGRRFCPQAVDVHASPVGASIETVEVSNYDGERRFLTRGRASARFERGVLVLEYLDERSERPSLADFDLVVESLHGERPGPD